MNSCGSANGELAAPHSCRSTDSFGSSWANRAAGQVDGNGGGKLFSQKDDRGGNCRLCGGNDHG